MAFSSTDLVLTASDIGADPMVDRGTATRPAKRIPRSKRQTPLSQAEKCFWQEQSHREEMETCQEGKKCHILFRIVLTLQPDLMGT